MITSALHIEIHLRLCLRKRDNISFFAILTLGYLFVLNHLRMLMNDLKNQAIPLSNDLQFITYPLRILVADAILYQN